MLKFVCLCSPRDRLLFGAALSIQGARQDLSRLHMQQRALKSISKSKTRAVIPHLVSLGKGAWAVHKASESHPRLFCNAESKYSKFRPHDRGNQKLRYHSRIWKLEGVEMYFVKCISIPSRPRKLLCCGGGRRVGACYISWVFLPGHPWASCFDFGVVGSGSVTST